MKPLTVLVAVDHAVGITGPHRNVVSSLNALASLEGVAVRLLCGRIDEREYYARSGRVDIHLGFDPHMPGAFWANLRSLHKCSHGVDVIYCPTGLKSLLYLQSIRGGRKLVAGPNVTPLPIRRVDSPGWVELNLLCDLWLEASRARYEHVMRYTGNHRKLRLVHHGLDTELFTPARRKREIWSKYGIALDGLKVLCVVRRERPLKGVPQLVEAAEILGRSPRGRGVDFVIVGELLPATLERAARLSNVHCLGVRERDELADIYASADIAVVPSTWEGFGFTVLEAMASGLAVVASRTGGIVDLIEHGVSGVLIEIVGSSGSHRPDAGAIIATAITELMEDEARRELLGRNARRRAVEHFSEAALAKRLLAVLSEC